VPLLILLVARRHRRHTLRGAATLAASGVLALGGAVALGSVWYLRTWIMTGNPLFPFYVSVLGGHAVGWDAQRSALLQTVLSLYGAGGKGVVDYLATPLWVSVLAQPEDTAWHEGVLGITVLFCLPFLAWALWRRRLDQETTLAAVAGGVLFAFWLSSSQHLRYLLPALPSLALAGVAAVAVTATRWSDASRLRSALLGTTAVGYLVVASWFLDAAPVRAALGGEPRFAYLERRLEYFPYYRILNDGLPASVRVWLIDMRRDSYHLDRPYVSDYFFEDWTIHQWVEGARSASDVRARARAAGITHVLIRHDLLLDPARSPLVDDRRGAEINAEKMQILRSFLLDGTTVIRGDPTFLLVDLDGARSAPRP